MKTPFRDFYYNLFNTDNGNTQNKEAREFCTKIFPKKLIEEDVVGLNKDILKRIV